MGYMDDILYVTEVASPGTSTLVVEELHGEIYATEVASPISFGASTLVADELCKEVIHTTEVVSPYFGRK